MTREGMNVAAAILDGAEGKDPDTGKLVRHPSRLVDCKGLDSEGDEAAFRFRFVIAAEVARSGRSRMSDRQRAAKARLRAAGRSQGGPPPFGWRNVRRDDGVFLELHEAEAAVLKECAARVLAGASLASASRFMNGPDGMPPHRAKAWTRETVRGVLTSRPSAASQDVLTADDRAALRQMLLARRGERRGGRQHSRLLSGLLRCSGCDGPLYVAPRTPTKLAYRCMTSPASGGSCHAPVSVSAEAIEAYVADWFLSTYGDRPEYAARATVTGGAALEAAHESEAAALAALTAEPTAEHLAAYQAAQGARRTAEDVPQEVTASLTPTGRTIAEAWGLDEDVHRRRELLAANVTAMVVLPGVRGRKTFDGRRVAIVMNPAFVGEPHEYPLGRVVGDSND
jgi:hypothetical protein